jgi:hypothetical protein
MIIRCFVVCALLCACLGAQTVKGSLTVNDKTFEMKYVYAFQVPDRMEPGSKGASLLVSDVEIPEKLRKPDPNPFDLEDAGVNGLRIELYGEGTNYMAALIGGGISGSMSISGTVPTDWKIVQSSEEIQVTAVKPPDSLGSNTWGFRMDIQSTLIAFVEKPKAKPTPEDNAAAAKAASTKAYLAYQQAMAKGDLVALEKMVVPERAAQMKQPEFKEMFELMREMMAKNVKVLKATESGDEAELVLMGSMMGEAEEDGVAFLKRVGGRWLVEREKWGDIQ